MDKNKLNKGFWINKQIDSKLRQMEELTSMAEKATTVISDTPRNPSPQKDTSDIVVKIIGLKDEIEGEIDALIDLKRELKDYILKIDNPQHRLILELRHIELMTFQEIADELGYDVRQVHRIYGEMVKKMS